MAEGWDHNTWPTQRAADAGARWDRWVLEWSRIQPLEDQQPAWKRHEGDEYDYDYDIAVEKDLGTSPPLNRLIVLGNVPDWFDLASLDELVFFGPREDTTKSRQSMGLFRVPGFESLPFHTR